MADDNTRDGDTERLDRIRWAWPRSESGGYIADSDEVFLLRVLDARDAALRDACAEAVRFKHAFRALCAVLDVPSHPLDWDSIRKQVEGKLSALRDARAGIERLQGACAEPDSNDDDRQITDRAWEIANEQKNTYWYGRKLAIAEFREKVAAAERACIVALIQKAANREINSPYARRVLEILAERVERGEHAQPEPAKGDGR